MKQTLPLRVLASQPYRTPPKNIPSTRFNEDEKKVTTFGGRGTVLGRKNWYYRQLVRVHGCVALRDSHEQQKVKNGLSVLRNVGRYAQ